MRSTRSPRCSPARSTWRTTPPAAFVEAASMKRVAARSTWWSRPTAATRSTATSTKPSRAWRRRNGSSAGGGIIVMAAACGDGVPGDGAFAEVVASRRTPEDLVGAGVAPSSTAGRPRCSEGCCNGPRLALQRRVERRHDSRRAAVPVARPGHGGRPRRWPRLGGAGRRGASCPKARSTVVTASPQGANQSLTSMSGIECGPSERRAALRLCRPRRSPARSGDAAARSRGTGRCGAHARDRRRQAPAVARDPPHVGLRPPRHHDRGRA